MSYHDEDDFLSVARMILEGKSFPPKKEDKGEKEDKGDEGPKDDEVDDAGPEELEGGDADAKPGFKKKPKNPDMSKDPDKGKPFDPEAGESDEQEEDPKSLPDKEDRSSPDDGEGGTVPGEEGDGEENVDLVDGSSKSEIDTEPAIKDDQPSTDPEDAEKKDGVEDKGEEDPKDPKKDPDAGESEKEDKKISGDGPDKSPDESDDEMDPESDENKEYSDDEKPKKSDIKKKLKAKKADKGKIVDKKSEAVNEKHIGFSKLKAKLAHEPGVTNPGGLAAAIGRKKYGAKKMEHASEAGKAIQEEVDSGHHTRHDFVSPGHHARMYRYHDQMARVLERAIKKSDSKELRKQLDYHKRRCVHHTDHMSPDK